MSRKVLVVDDEKLIVKGIRFNLEQDGMLIRQTVPQDARLKKLVPTEKAIAIHEDIAEKFQIAEALMTAGLTEEELAQFIATARKIQRNLLE